MRFFVFMLLMLFFHVSFSQNEKVNSHWYFSLEGNNSIRYSYIPPNTNPGPNQTYRPVGTSYKSNFGIKLFIGKTDHLLENANIDYGLEFLTLGKTALRDKDSLMLYYDTSGIIYDYRTKYNNFAIALPFGVSYFHKKAIISGGVSLPVLVYKSFLYENFEESKKTIQHSWLWNIEFPSFCFYLKLAYNIHPKINILAGYSYNTSDVFFDNRVFSFGIRYTY